MKHVIIVSAIAAALLASPSVMANNKKRAEIEAQERQSAQAMVDARMADTLKSIEQSLDLLVSLSRGGEPPRAAPAAYGNTAPNPIAPTVAGAARQIASDERVSAAPAVVPPATATEKKVAELRNSQLNEALDRRIDVSWTGSAHDLLASLASQIGYSYATGRTSVGQGGTRVEARVKISAKNATVREVLQQVADQVSPQASVFVSVPQRSISLLVK